MKNPAFLSIVICMGCLRLTAQSGVSPMGLSREPQSCSLLVSQSNQTDAQNNSALLNAYNLQANSIRSYHLVATVQGKDESLKGIAEPPPLLPALIDFVDPDLIRVTVTPTFLGGRRFEMASDGKVVQLLAPHDGKITFLVGPVDAHVHLQGGTIGILLHSLIDALRWPEAKLIAAQQPQGSPDSNVRKIQADLSLNRTGAHSVQIEFDLSQGQVNSVATYDLAGQLISKATYSDWQQVALSPSSPSPACLPRRIDFVLPRQNYEITLRLAQITLNPEIPRSSFRISPPRGIPVVHLDEFETSITR